jgi:hypothetical protein
MVKKTERCPCEPEISLVSGKPRLDGEEENRGGAIARECPTNRGGAYGLLFGLANAFRLQPILC